MIKIEKKLQKPYPTDNNLLIAQDLWQAHYQVFLIISPKEFIKLDVNINLMIKNVKLGELNAKMVTTFLNKQTLKIT